MFANYHTHTARCGHACGEDRDYVEAAVRAGFTILGFSDHTPYEYVDDYVSYIRMPMDALEGYVSSLLALQEEYKGKIELHIGLEAEYYPRLFPRLLHRLRELPIEYLLLGQHNLGNEYDGAYSGAPTADPADLIQYCDQCIEGMQTGLFTYFAHPELLHFVGEPAVYDREMRRLCREAISCHLPLEFNLNGFRQKRYYPTERFWQIAAEEGGTVIIGSDAHNPIHVDLPALEADARAILGKYGITPIETTPIVNIQK